MPGGQTAVAEATAAVFVEGRRAGSAVLVTARYLVTAAHVLLRFDPGAGARVPVGQAEVEFPGLGEEGGRQPACHRLDVRQPQGWLGVSVGSAARAVPQGQLADTTGISLTCR